MTWSCLLLLPCVFFFRVLVFSILLSLSLAPCYLLLVLLRSSPLRSCSASRPFLSFSSLLLLVLASCFLFFLALLSSFIFLFTFFCLLLFLCLPLASVSTLVVPCQGLADFRLKGHASHVGWLHVKNCCLSTSLCVTYGPLPIMTSSRRSYHDWSYLAPFNPTNYLAT